MKNNKRGRGRPIGTGLDDGPTLKKVADMIVVNPSLRPTTAIRRTLGAPGESTIRRLQVKWKAVVVEYLADARDRRAVALTPARRTGASYSPRTARQLAQAHKALQDALGGTSLRAVHEEMNSPGQRAALEYMNSPAFRAAQKAMCRYEDNPATRALWEAQNSPAMRAIEQVWDSPDMRAIKELQNSPAMRVYRELQDSPAMRVARALGGYNF